LFGFGQHSLAEIGASAPVLRLFHWRHFENPTKSLRLLV
jgi:hypothetical protein